MPLAWTDASGISVRKIFTLRRGSYAIEQRQEITNKGETPWSARAYRQLQRVPVVDTKGIKAYSNTERYSFIGAAWYNASEKFQKIKFDNFAKEPLDRHFAGGWAAMLQHYFFAAWIPDANEDDTYTTSVVQNADAPRYLIRTQSPTITVAPGETKTDTARLYVGPKLQSTLDEVAPGLSLTVDYGIFTIIAKPLHWIRAAAQAHGQGFAIILLVVLIKLAFFKLSEAQYRSMARMRKMQPRMEALKERYGDDRQEAQSGDARAVPEGKDQSASAAVCRCSCRFRCSSRCTGCCSKASSFAVRRSFCGSRIFSGRPIRSTCRLVLNGLAMIATQWLTPSAGMDPMQAKMMKIMPVAFSVLFAFFPAGLVLYWTVNGPPSLLQQWIITKRIENADVKAKA